MEMLPLYKLAIAVGLGLLVGLQRECSDSQVAGIRTFPIIALLGCMTGLLAERFGGWVVAGGLLALGAVVVAAKSFPNAEGENPAAGTTTQAACLLVFVANSGLAAGYVTEAVVVCGALAALLHWKTRLHGFAHRIGREELHAVVQMTLIALVILPILPNRTFGPYAVINPFEIWLMVVLIVGISLAAYVISRLVSAKKGTLLAGILGGLISSTATTVSCARRSRDSQLAVRVSAAIILISMPVVFARVIFEVAVVAPEILAVTFPPLVIVMLVMIGMAAICFRRCTDEAPSNGDGHPPSDLKTAIGFGLLYMFVLIAAAAARDHFGNSGLYVVAFISGLTDMDAITLSSAQLVKSGQLPAMDCWRVILVGALSNLAFKSGVVALLGNRELVRRTAWGFAVSVLAGILMLALWP